MVDLTPLQQDALLRVEDLQVDFKTRGGTVHAVSGVSFDVLPGETLGIVGESGCGKSTLGRAVLRLSPHAGGRIVFDGAEIHGIKGRKLRELRRRMQMVFQDPVGSLNPRRHVRELVTEGLADEGPPRRGGELVLVMSAEPRSLDPTVMVNNWGIHSTLGNTIYGSLVGDASGTGGLTESLKSADEGLNWTLTLKDGLTFSDGSPLDAEAVAFNWEAPPGPEVGVSVEGRRSRDQVGRGGRADALDHPEATRAPVPADSGEQRPQLDRRPRRTAQGRRFQGRTGRRRAVRRQELGTRR